MRKLIMLVVILFAFVIISCQQVSISESGNNEQITTKEAVCSPPYIKNYSNCCLDQNNNGICDSDEVKKELQPQAETPKEIAAQPSESREQQQETEKKPTGTCSLSAGMICADFKISRTNIMVTLSNSLNYDARSVVVEAQNCGDGSVLDLAKGESKTFTIVCSYPLPGSSYDGVLSVQYTNVNTRISYYDSGKLKGNIE